MTLRDARRIAGLLAGVAAAVAVSVAAATAQDPVAPAGTTLPVHRGHADLLADAERFQAEGRLEAAVALLEDLAAADPADLLPTADPLLFLGVSRLALERLAALGADGRALRQRLVGARAQQEVEAALLPPDLPRLEALARRYAGLAAGERAAAAAAELWLDRGQPERAAAYRTVVESDGPRLRAEPAHAARLPAHAEDPALVALEPAPLQPLWSADFLIEPRFDRVVRHRLAFGAGLIFASDGFSTAAFEAGTGHLVWSSLADPDWLTLDGDSVERLREAESVHRLNAPVLAEGLLLSVVNEARPLGRSDRFQRIPIRRTLPARRLVAFDARTGREVWRMRMDWENPDGDPRGIVAGPPAAAAGRVYVPVYDAIGTVDLRLVALDLRTGERLWQRFLASGQLETNLFGNVLVELAVPPPLADAETVQVCSHLGSFHALDSATGAVLWSRLYQRAEVRPTETGAIARRSQPMIRNLGASDGRRAAWAPVDGEEIHLLDARTGGLLGRWPSLDDEERHLSVLLGMDDAGVWACGSRIARLSPEDAARDSWSEPITDEGGLVAPGQAGCLLRGAVLLPWNQQSVERFDAASLDYTGRALEFVQRGESGALQAAPGLLLIARPEGFAVYGSRATLASGFADARLPAAKVEELLPIALQLDFTPDPQAARALMEGALALAGRPDLAPLAEELRLLGARAAAAARETRRAEELLLELLTADGQEIAAAAAGLLLDELLLRDPLAPSVRAALDRAGDGSLALLTLADGSQVPAAAAIARARALRAIAGDSELAAADCLAALLLEEGAAALKVAGAPAHAWAEQRLREVLGNPGRLAAFELTAQEALRARSLDAALLRAYGRTRVAQDALEAELARRDLPRAEQLRRARWRREYGDPERDWRDFDRFLGSVQPAPVAPRRLLPRVIHSETGLVPLTAASAGPEGALVWLRTQGSVQLVALTPHRTETRRSFRLSPSVSGDRAFATEEGCALLLRDALVHLGADGSQRDHPLPDRLLTSTSPLDLGGGVIAAALEAGGAGFRVVVLDAISGELYLDLTLPGEPLNRCELRSDGRWLYLFEDQVPRAYRLDLHFATAPLAFSLPAQGTGYDLNSISVRDGRIHYFITSLPKGSSAFRSGVGLAALELDYPNQILRRLRLQPGLAFIPMAATRDAAATGPREVHWLLPDADAAIRIQVPPEARPLQLVESEARRAPEHLSGEMLLLAPAEDGATRLLAHRPEPGGPAWWVDLPGIPWDRVQGPQTQPQPRRAADAWVVPLLLRATRSDPARVALFLLEPDGRLRDRVESELRGGGAEQLRLDLLPGAILLRDGNSITLYGDF